jgi:hypothetical protein
MNKPEDEIKYRLSNGDCIFLHKKGNTYIGKEASNIMHIWNRRELSFDEQYEWMELLAMSSVCLRS